MKSHILSCIVAALWCVAFTTELQGQGTTFTFQGRLSESNGPLNGSAALIFRLYATAAGGPSLWQETHPSIAVSNGLFAATLGPNTPLNETIFSGGSRWLGISVNGSAELTPRQRITATPYAITAGNVTGVLPPSGLSGVYSGALTLMNAANSFRGVFTGNGAELTNLNAVSLAGQTPSNFWQTAGNLNTTAGTHFLGTRDNEPLDIRVNNGRIARFEPGANVTLGNFANFITNGVVGSTIAGGRFNTNNADDSTISGGRNNRIDPASGLSSIGGGVNNTVEAGADQSVIGGGNRSTVELGARESFIGGGFANTIGSGGIVAFVGGGTRNTNSGFASFVGGGQLNVVETGGANSVIGGGVDNTVNANAQYATIPGGRSNRATNYAFAAGHRAKANHQGAFVWADSTDADFASSSGNQFLIRASRGVGVGTSDPEAFLHVASAGSAAPQLRLEQTVNDEFARLRFTSTTKPYWDVAVGGANDVMNFYSFGNGNVMTLTTNGNLSVDGTIKGQVIEITGGADFSENFDISGDAHEPGMIVTIDPANPGRLALSSAAYDKKVAGIISGAGGVRPGMLMGQRGSVADGKHPVALTGRVYCWVDAGASGAIEPGDMLTTSDTAGHGMKATDASRATGAIIGKAMTGLDHGKGLVLVLVNLQ